MRTDHTYANNDNPAADTITTDILTNDGSPVDVTPANDATPPPKANCNPPINAEAVPATATGCPSNAVTVAFGITKPTLNIINANNATTTHNAATPVSANTTNPPTDTSANTKPKPKRRNVSTRPTNKPFSCVPAIIPSAFTANNPAYNCGETPNSDCETKENADTYVNNIPKLKPNVRTGPTKRG